MSVLDKFLDAIRLNDDFDDDDEFFDDEDLEALDEEKPKHRFFKKLNDDDDEDEEVEYVKPEKKVAPKQTKAPKQTVKQATPSASSKITPMRKKNSGNGTMEVCVIKPSSMEDTREIADTLIDRCTVVLNLEGIDVDVAQRIHRMNQCCFVCNIFYFIPLQVPDQMPFEIFRKFFVFGAKFLYLIFSEDRLSCIHRLPNHGNRFCLTDCDQNYFFRIPTAFFTGFSDLSSYVL